MFAVINSPRSERRPIPTIQGYEQSRRDQLAADNAAANAQPSTSDTTSNSKQTSASNDPATEKQELMNRMAGPKEKPTDKVKERQGNHVVKDPTTGEDITIKDAEFDGKLTRSSLPILPLIAHAMDRLSKTRRHCSNQTWKCPLLPLPPCYPRIIHRNAQQLGVSATWSFYLVWVYLVLVRIPIWTLVDALLRSFLFTFVPFYCHWRDGLRQHDLRLSHSS